MERVDRRIVRTQHLLMDALVALAQEKSYDAITIRDITEQADVSYSTFFRHYTEKDELLAEVLKSVIHQLRALLNHNPNRTKQEEGILIFQHVAQNQAFFRVMFSSQGTNRVLETTRAEIVADILRAADIPTNNPIPPEILANHIVATILALVRWWLDHDLPYRVERMGEIYSLLLSANSLPPETE